MTRQKKWRWQITLRGLFIATTFIFIFGYQQHQIIQLRRRLAEERAETARTQQQVLQARRRSLQVTMGQLRQTIRSAVGVPESVDQGMMLDSLQRSVPQGTVESDRQDRSQPGT